jgi:hypothetical protein
MYTEKETKAMINYLETKLREGVTREEAIEDLMYWGIVEADGNYTEFYNIRPGSTAQIAEKLGRNGCHSRICAMICVHLTETTQHYPTGPVYRCY